MPVLAGTHSPSASGSPLQGMAGWQRGCGRCICHPHCSGDWAVPHALTLLASAHGRRNSVPRLHDEPLRSFAAAESIAVRTYALSIVQHWWPRSHVLLSVPLCCTNGHAHPHAYPLSHSLCLPFLPSCYCVTSLSLPCSWLRIPYLRAAPAAHPSSWRRSRWVGG